MRGHFVSLNEQGQKANRVIWSTPTSFSCELRKIKMVLPVEKSSPSKFPKFQGAFVSLDALSFMLVTGKKNAHIHTHD